MTTVYSPPATYGLPPEPGAEVTDVWDATGDRWWRVPPQPPYGASWMPWEALDDEPTLATEAVMWEELLYEYGPLTTVDPSQPHHLVGPLGDLCQLPGCNREPDAEVHDGTPWEQLEDRSDPLPPVPDVPNVIGTEAGDGLLHAIEPGSSHCLTEGSNRTDS